MQDLGWSSRVAANSIENQFRDLHRLLDQVTEFQEKLDTISASVVRCSRELQSIERIYVNRWRFYGAEAQKDPFGLQDILYNFSTTCSSLKHIQSPTDDDNSESETGCIPGMGSMLPSMPARRGWKRKQIKALEMDLSKHEKILALALSNIVYTTTLKIHRARTGSSSSTATILRCAERRHALLDRSDVTSLKATHVKDDGANIEEMDWEVSLRQYFDLIEEWTGEPDEDDHAGNGSQATSRASSLTRTQWSRPTARQTTHPPVSNETRGRSMNIDHRRKEEVDTNQYFRQPRRRSSSASSVGWVPANQSMSRLSGSFSRSSSELVIYNPRHSLSSSSITQARPIRRASISNDFHWEYVGRSSTFDTLAPLTSRWPELKDAQVDIYTQTQGMSSSEARAYSLGRLAGLSPDITTEVRRVLSMKSSSREPVLKAQQSTIRVINQPSPQNMNAPRRSISLDGLKRSALTESTSAANSVLPGGRAIPKRQAEMTARSGAKGEDSLVPRLTPKPKNNAYQRHPPESVRPIRNIVPSVQKRGFLGTLSDLRPMTAISERSSRSAFSRTSMDKPQSRGLMQGFKSRKMSRSQLSILEPSILETVADKGEGRSSSGSDTLISSKEYEHGLVPRTAQSQKTMTTSSTMNVHKPLPPRPRRSYGPKLFGAVFKTRKDKSSLQVPLAASFVSLHGPGSISQESFRRVSMEMRKKRDSKMAMKSSGDDIPFDMWLRALPYIEGRCNTPRAIQA